MDLEIIAVRYGFTPETAETISAYQWRSPAGEVDSSDKPTMVAWLDKEENRAHVASGAKRVEVGVRREAGKQPWLQTYSDGQWDNNLTSLPTF
jgi:hypothetical protein